MSPLCLFLGIAKSTVIDGKGRSGDVFPVLRFSVLRPAGITSTTGSRIPETFERVMRDSGGRIRLPSAPLSMSTILGVPTLDGGVAVDGKISQRSRRGKYPVVELWRHPEVLPKDSLGDSDAGRHMEGCDDIFLEGRSRSPEGETALEYLRKALGLGSAQTDAIQEAFPALAQIDPDRFDVRAKLRFVQHTMGADPAIVATSFPQFFGHPLERHIAPRHAFLVASGRPSGAKLLENGCRGARRMIELSANRFVAEMVPGTEMSDYRRFETSFLRGPFDAARKGDAMTLRLLRSHGWDCWETDRRGRTALFWAAGAGSVEACSALIEGGGGLRARTAAGDGATPLHWAAAGVEARRFGTGGHGEEDWRRDHNQPNGTGEQPTARSSTLVRFLAWLQRQSICRWLVRQGADPRATTSEGNTVLMWAAWAGGLDVTRWAVEETRADLEVVNGNGCSAAHWAASGGDDAVCRYLHSIGTDFTRVNRGGNDPLNHAVAYGRRHVAAWLLGEGSAIAVAPLRRSDDPVLLDLARLTGDEVMQAFLKGR